MMSMSTSVAVTPVAISNISILHYKYDNHIVIGMIFDFRAGGYGSFPAATISAANTEKYVFELISKFILRHFFIGVIPPQQR
jgi:hypothetical protein